MEWIPRNFLHCCKERYIIRFSSPYFSPNDVASRYVVWYTYPNKKQESVQVELLKTDELIVSESPKSDKPCAVSVAVQSRQNGKVVAYFTIELLSLADYLFKKVFFPFQAITPEVVDPQIANRILAMFMAYYCNIGDGINDERQTDGILQTLLSQLKDHKGNLASITTGPYGTQENIIHFVLRNKLNKTAHYLIRNMRGYDHLFLEQDRNHKTPFDLAHNAGFSDLESDIKQKVNSKKPLVRTQSNTAYEAQYENPSLQSNGNRHLRKGVVKERYKHPGLLEILEVGDTVDIISGPDGGVYEVMIRDNHCFIPEVIIWLEGGDDQSDAPHTYEEIQFTKPKANKEDLYMTLKPPVESQNPRVANHYVMEPYNPSPVANNANERSPLAPPRNKDAKKPQMQKSATLPTRKKSAPVQKPAPYRPPPPKFTSVSAMPPSPKNDKDSPTDTIKAPPRKSKSVTKEPIYEDLIVKQSTSISSDTVQEYDECYVEPVDVPGESSEPDYLEMIIPSPTTSGNIEQKSNESTVTNDSAAKKENDKEAATVKLTTHAAKTNQAMPATDSSDQMPKKPADSTDTKEKEQKSKQPADSTDAKEKEQKSKQPADSTDTKEKEQKSKQPADSTDTKEKEQKSKQPADSTDTKEKEQKSKQPADSTDTKEKEQKSKQPADSTDTKEKEQKSKQPADSTDTKEKEQKSKQPADSTDTKEKEQKSKQPADSTDTKEKEQKSKQPADSTDTKEKEQKSKQPADSTDTKEKEQKSKQPADSTDTKEKEQKSKQPADSTATMEKEKDQKSKVPADSADTKEKSQNLTISQARKMFEAKVQSTPNSNKVMSPTSKVFKSKNTTNVLNNAESKVTAKQKSGTDDGAASANNGLPNGQSSPTQPEIAMTPEQKQGSWLAAKKPEENAVSEKVANKSSKPTLAKKPHI